MEYSKDIPTISLRQKLPGKMGILAGVYNKG